MTPVERARQRYLTRAGLVARNQTRCTDDSGCPWCLIFSALNEADSVALDMAMAASFTERTRGSGRS